MMIRTVPIAHFEERIPRPAPPQRREGGDPGGGPRQPEVGRPNAKDLLERMRRVDPNQARRYRQRSGE
jgi:hypothetical protein